MSMRNFILRRVLLMFPLFVGVAILSFMIVSLSPIDIVDIQSTGNPNMGPDEKQRLKEEYHFVTRPETEFTAKNAPVRGEEGWTPTFPALRSYHVEDTLAVLRFDNASASPQDQSRTPGNTVTHQGYYNGSASVSMKNATTLEDTNSVTIAYSNWEITDELTIMFWMNWSGTGLHGGTLFEQGTNIDAAIQRPGVLTAANFDQTSLTFRIGEYSIEWTNHTLGYANITTLRNEWHHYAFVANAGALTIYLDGLPLLTETTALDTIPLATPTGSFVLGSSNFAAYADDLFIYNRSFGAEDMSAWTDAARLGDEAWRPDNFQPLSDAQIAALQNTADEDYLTTMMTEADNYAWQILAIDFRDIRTDNPNWEDHVPVLTLGVTARCEATEGGSVNEALSGVETYIWSTDANGWRSFGRTTANSSWLENTARLPGPRERWDHYLPPTYGEVTILVKSQARATTTTALTLQVDSLRMGLVLSYETPLWEQFVYWFTAFLTGEDNSFVFNDDSISVISIFAWETVKLQFAALILSLMIAVPVGVISATRQYSKIDNLAMTGALMGISLPVFWTGLVLILIFAFYFPIFPSGGAYDRLAEPSFPQYGTWSLDAAWHMVLPTIILGTAGAALITRLVRSSMLEVLRQDYIVTARAKGLTERIVVYKHALRNALLPVVTVVGLSLGFALSGAALTETVFSWPGLGKIAVYAAIARDYHLILGINIVIAMIVIVANLLTDVSYAFLDPRIRY